MNKIAIITLLFTFAAVASAQGNCEVDILSALPNIEKLSLDITAQRWVAVESDLETLIPVTETILKDCANFTSNDTVMQQCIDGGEALARLLVPLAVNPFNVSAMWRFAEQAPGILKGLYTNCIRKTDQIHVKQLHLHNKISITCVFALNSLIAPTKTLVNDTENEVAFPVLQTDLNTFVNAAYNACQNCGVNITLPDQADFNQQQCLNNIATIMVDTDDIINALGDVETMIDAVERIAAILPSTVPVCGI